MFDPACPRDSRERLTVSDRDMLISFNTLNAFPPPFFVGNKTEES